jgi:23S rRNA (adenine2503-C2)-methyltransferase
VPFTSEGVKMKIEKIIEVPTGHILIVNGDKGLLECVSLGDYGKEQNIKADFLGLHREINKIDNTEIMPLTDKWVATISSQYGCKMNCMFCDVPKVGKGKNATKNDLVSQVDTIINLHPEIKNSKRLNIHYARMGEPTFNYNIFEATNEIIEKYKFNFHIHPVISTMSPKKNTQFKDFIDEWVDLKNNKLSGEAGLQFSINSTDELEREKLFNGNTFTLEELSYLTKHLTPKGRKFTLNFALADFKVDASIIAKYFSPKNFMIKITPMHKTHTAEKNKIKTEGDYTTIYPYLNTEEDFKKYGFDVLVFLASNDEDMSRITCGNAILSGSLPETPYRIVHI